MAEIIAKIEDRMKTFTNEEANIVYTFVDFIAKNKSSNIAETLDRMNSLMEPNPWKNEDELFEEMRKDRIKQ